MKIAVLSDIHGNWPALQAVAADIDRWQPDQVLVNGDVVNSGPESARCWAYVRERQQQDGWTVLAGNHEAYVLEWATEQPPLDGPAYDLIRLSHWTYGHLQDEIGALAALPAAWRTVLPGAGFVAARHASMLGDRAGIYPDAAEEKVRGMIDREAAVFLVAHTHLPDIRQIDGTLLVNSGAVGWPGDGDGRSSYARLSWGRSGYRAEIRRVAYDRTATERAFHSSGLLAVGGAEALLSFMEWRMSTDLRTIWSRRYRAAILSGAIDHADSVARFVVENGLEAALPDQRRVH